MAVGRNVWKAKNPIDVSKRLRKIIFKWLYCDKYLFIN
jgi:DhnA family fructose-bisphosphate aldolase class Ia